MLGFSHFYRLNTLILGQFPCFSGIFHIKPFDRPIFLNYPENLHWERLKGLQAHMSRPMKGWYQNGTPKGVFELERRFAREIQEATRTRGTRCAPRKRHSRGLER